MVEFVAAKCPNCGAELQLPADKDSAYCTYCGASVLIEKDAKKEVHYHKDTHYHYEDKVPASIPKPVYNTYREVERSREANNSTKQLLLRMISIAIVILMLLGAFAILLR